MKKNNDNKKRIGRPKKKSYNEAEQFKELLDTVDYIYDTTGEINATAAELDMSSIKVKKLLITSGKLEYEETKQIQKLMAYGKGLNEIQNEMGLKKSSINSYLPYSKVPYKEAEVSANADRCELYRKRKRAIENIVDFEGVWSCIELFSGYPFYTTSGLKYNYSVKDEEILIESKEIVITKAIVNKLYDDVVNKKIINNKSNKLDDSKAEFFIFPVFCRLGLMD